MAPPSPLRQHPIVLKISYDGSCFAGFQRQPHAHTVQGSLEASLQQILAHPVSLQGAGRTDTGVHALGQIVAFHTPKSISLSRLCHSLNCVLPSGVQVIEAALHHLDSIFHPRFDALSRTYSYYILDGCRPSEFVLWSQRTWCSPLRLDLDLAQQAACNFLGEHNFSTFSYRLDPGTTSIRRILESEITIEPLPHLLAPHQGPRLLRFRITANGFLRRMVRLVTAAIVNVALNRYAADEVTRLIAAANPRLAPHPAPPQGLYFDRVCYPICPFTDPHKVLEHHVVIPHSSYRLKI